MSTSARLLRLLSLLQHNLRWSGPALAARLEVSDRTLRRDIERLRSLGYAIASDRGHDGGYQLTASASLPPLLLEADEVVARENGTALFETDLRSAFDVMGHLVHGERADWMPRVEHLLLHGEGVAFPPFDRFAQLRESEGKSLGDLLDEFAALRAASLKPRFSSPSKLPTGTRHSSK